MLELAHYLISDWRRVADGTEVGACVRDIQDATTRAHVGRVHGGTSAKKGWLRWLRSYRLEVKETDDESLLLVLNRPWRVFRLWDVYDADNLRIGSVYPPSILDEEGVRRAFVERGLSGRGRIVSVEGRTLAEMSSSASNELHLRFADDLEENPFLRMLLLASAIALDTLPVGA